MRRLLLLAVLVFAACWLLGEFGILPEPIARVVGPIVGLGCSLAIPGFFLLAYAVPGLFREAADDFGHFWHRLRTRRHDLEDLERKIAHLDRAYHMQQLGMLYASQGRAAKAQSRGSGVRLAKDPNRWKHRYQLGLCHFAQKDYPAAAELLEAVYAEKPEHDYGSMTTSSAAIRVAAVLWQFRRARRCHTKPCSGSIPAIPRGNITTPCSWNSKIHWRKPRS